MPRVRDTLREIDIPELTLAGDGAAPPPVIALPSCEFRPDVALLYRRARVVGFEVKFLRTSGRQYSLAAAIGQAVIYRSQVFEAVGIILIDLASVLGEAEAIHSMVDNLQLLCHISYKSGVKLVNSQRYGKRLSTPKLSYRRVPRGQEPRARAPASGE